MDAMYLTNPTQYIPIIWSQWVGVHQQTERTWRARLFTWPWRPHEKYDSVFIPKAMLYRNPGSGHPTMIVAHPVMRDELFGALENMTGPPTQVIEGVTPQPEWPERFRAVMVEVSNTLGG